VKSYKVALTGDIVSPPRVPQASADSGQFATGRSGNASMLLTKVLFHGPRKRIKKKPWHPFWRKQNHWHSSFVESKRDVIISDVLAAATAIKHTHLPFS
jgi:hypothetical protein